MQIKAMTVVVAVFMATWTGGATEFRPVPNYWCTWVTQGATLADNLKAGKIRFPSFRGTPAGRLKAFGDAPTSSWRLRSRRAS